MPDRPSSAAPRSMASSTVSAWSSMVWPVSTPGGSASYRARRARASRSGPGGDLHCSRLVSHAVAGGRGGNGRGLGRRAGSEAMVDVDRYDRSSPAVDGQDQQGQRVGPAGHGQRQGLGPPAWFWLRERAAGQESGQQVVAAGGGNGGCRRRTAGVHQPRATGAAPVPGPAREIHSAGLRISAQLGSHCGPSQTLSSSSARRPPRRPR